MHDQYQQTNGNQCKSYFVSKSRQETLKVTVGNFIHSLAYGSEVIAEGKLNSVYLYENIVTSTIIIP